MLLQKQAFGHDPENGIWGDCHRTAYAMVLGLERDKVPHVMGSGTTWEKANADMLGWLHSIGMTEVCFPVASPSTDDVIKNWSTFAKDVPFVLGGMSKTGVGHSVAVLNGEIFDPSTKDSGIAGPMDDGYYWITLLVPRRSNP
jgi:hypothetical protein